jgi:hypothetical protein
MNFDQHLFISYAHLDDQPVLDEPEGWVARFHKSLSAILSMRIGGRAKIWFDPTLQSNDVFADEISEQLERTAVLVSIVSPRYLQSKWCKREISEFCKSAEKTGGVRVGNKTRFFKVLKAPVDSEDYLPEVAREITGEEFFVMVNSIPEELDYGKEHGQAYKRKVGKLAWEMAQLLKDLGIGPSRSAREQEAIDAEAGEDANNATESASGTGDRPTIYLAECARDCRESREIIEGDLKRHGFRVIPERNLPRDEEEYVAAVENLLKQCTLSVHLLGSQYGAIPDGESQKSIVELQNSVAVEQSRNGSLQRIIWLPDGTASDVLQQQAFIDAMHEQADLQYGADLITGDLERLKSSIHRTIRTLAEPAPEGRVASADSPALVYVICSEKDRHGTVPLRKYLRDKGFEVCIPAFEGDATAVREAHQNLLANCDAVILFYGSGDEAWKRTNHAELIKMAGYRDGRPVMANFTYLADPVTSDKKELVELEEPDLIDCLEGFSEGAIEPFLAAVRKNK